MQIALPYIAVKSGQRLYEKDKGIGRASLQLQLLRLQGSAAIAITLLLWIRVPIHLVLGMALGNIAVCTALFIWSRRLDIVSKTQVTATIASSKLVEQSAANECPVQ